MNESISGFFDSLACVQIIGPLIEEQKTSAAGKPYTRRRQRAVYSYVVDDIRMQMPCEISVPREIPGYAAGLYMPAGSQYSVGRFGDLESDNFAMALIRIPDPVVRLIEQDRTRTAKAA